MKSRVVWKFIYRNRRVTFTADKEFVPGKPMHVSGVIRACCRGFHGSFKLEHAVKYRGQKNRLSLVRLWGDSDTGHHKVCARSIVLLADVDVSQIPRPEDAPWNVPDPKDPTGQTFIHLSPAARRRRNVAARCRYIRQLRNAMLQRLDELGKLKLMPRE